MNRTSPVTIKTADLILGLLANGREYTTDDFVQLLQVSLESVSAATRMLSRRGSISGESVKKTLLYSICTEKLTPAAAAAMECKAASARDQASYVPGGTPTKYIAPPCYGKVERNAHIIARLVQDHGPMTRAQVLDRSGLTNTTISNVIDRAKESGLIHWGGRPGNLYFSGPKPQKQNGKAA
jgi:CRP-like cAMP-binding protein